MLGGTGFGIASSRGWSKKALDGRMKDRLGFCERSERCQVCLCLGISASPCNCSLSLELVFSIVVNAVVNPKEFLSSLGRMDDLGAHASAHPT